MKDRTRVLKWLRSKLPHRCQPGLCVTEDGRLIRIECDTCSRPLYQAQRECCTPEDPCGPDDPDGICRECASYAYPEDIK